MVELYCELLLARANVLDQVAFGEKGAKARSRAKEEKARFEAEKRRASGAAAGAPAPAAGGNESGGGSKSFFGFPFGKAFGGGGGQQSKATATAAPPSSSSSSNQPKPADDTTDDEYTYIDSALDEAATAVFYAWPRFPHDVRELTIVRTLLTDRFGKDFMTLAQENKVEHVRVPERLAKGLRVRPPTQELVDSYLREIARAYGISWGEDTEQPIGGGDDLGNAPPEFVGDTTGGEGGDDDESGDNPELPSTPGKEKQHPDNTARCASETNELNKTTPPRRPVQSGKSPVIVAPPGARTDNLQPRVRVPGAGDADSTEESKESNVDNGAKKIPEVDELSRRFAALRR